MFLNIVKAISEVNIVKIIYFAVVKKSIWGVYFAFFSLIIQDGVPDLTPDEL